MKAKKSSTFDLVTTLVNAIKDGRETMEQLEYTLKNNPELLEKVKSQLPQNV